MVSIIKREYETNVYHFAVDAVAELDILPKIRTRGKDILNTIAGCAMGSTAIVTENSERYILSGARNEWIRLSAGSGDSDGGGDLPDGYTIADDSDVKNLFS